jgi:hypothetical protein
MLNRFGPPLPPEKVPVNPHRLDAAPIIRFRAGHNKESGQQ